jgi:hypothetical protein
MKFSKKFFIVLGLVAMLAASLFTTAFAADTKVVRFADVTKLQVLDDQPATFSILGSYICDRVQVDSYIAGKTIYINAYDVKFKNTGRGCGTEHSFKRTVNLGNLVPGTYIVVVNVDSSGKAGKKIRNFIAPLLPVKATSGQTQK